MTNLPKIDLPLFPVTVPSLDRKDVLFRPFTVKEEKVLLIANASKDKKDILLAVKQVINNCIQDPKIKVEQLAPFDIEYIFLKLRARSINNMVDFKYTDPEDNNQYDIRINLDEVELKLSETTPNPVVMIDKDAGFGIRLKYPTIEDSIEYQASGLEPEKVLELIIAACIEDVFNGEEVFEFNQYTPDQKFEFIDSIPARTFGEIQQWFDSMPLLTHTVEYKTKAGNSKSIVFEGLQDFFTWG